MLESRNVREALNVAARELNPSRSWPVDVARLARTLGLTIYVTKSSESGGATHLRISECPAIVIVTNARQEEALRTNFNRFSLAHEIGHWVIWRRFGYIPGGDKEYWEHERLCNEFAANLLVPADTLAHHLQVLRRRKIHPVYYPRIIASTADVSWHVAARAIVASGNCNSWYLRFVANGTSTFNVACSTVYSGESYLAERAKVSNEDLATWISSLQVGKIGTRPVSFIAGTYQFRAARAAVLRERGEKATLVMPRASTEVVQVRRISRSTHRGGRASQGIRERQRALFSTGSP